MTASSARVLYWTPRAIGILFALFVSLFALDVFDDHAGFWRTLAALLIHLAPALAIIAALALAWRREWIGAALFTGVGGFFFLIAKPGWEVRAMFCGPSLLVAGFFLANWLKRAELREALRPGGRS